MSDRLDWILSTPDSERALAARYDQWAASYNADHADWGWHGPAMASSALRVARGNSSIQSGLVLDAGCGTGLVGQALHDDGHDVDVLGVDLSGAMLRQARETGRYRDLIHASLYDLPLRPQLVDAVISTGVFTHGHVGPPALGELCRVTRPGGLIITTLRVDVIDTYADAIQKLTADGRWSAVHEFQPVQSHPDRNDTEQFTFVWQVA